MSKIHERMYRPIAIGCVLTMARILPLLARAWRRRDLDDAHLARRPVDEKELELLQRRQRGFDLRRVATDSRKPLEPPRVEHPADEHPEWLVIEARGYVRRLLGRRDDRQWLGAAALPGVLEHRVKTKRRLLMLGQRPDFI